MGKIDPPAWEHIIEHLPRAADVPLSVGRAGKGGVPLASRLREAFASWVWAVWPRSICNFPSIIVACLMRTLQVVVAISLDVDAWSLC
jgi:hypothetical protein